MQTKSRQQRANNKARKAKARAAHKAKFGSWINRKKHSQQKTILSPRTGLALSLAAMEALIARGERTHD